MIGSVRDRASPGGDDQGHERPTHQADRDSFVQGPSCGSMRHLDERSACLLGSPGVTAVSKERLAETHRLIGEQVHAVERRMLDQVDQVPDPEHMRERALAI
jgi:hypothetical protein